jgi:cysteine desulfurase
MEAADIVHAAGGLLHVDAIQAFGKISFDISGLKADLATLSAHKIGGPKGIGAVILAEGIQGLEPLLRGGGQELGRRAGTENVAGISEPRLKPSWQVLQPMPRGCKTCETAWNRGCGKPEV